MIIDKGTECDGRHSFNYTKRFKESTVFVHNFDSLILNSVSPASNGCQTWESKEEVKFNNKWAVFFICLLETIMHVMISYKQYQGYKNTN